MPGLHVAPRYKRSLPLLRSASVVCGPVEVCRTGPGPALAPQHWDKTKAPLEEWTELTTAGDQGVSCPGAGGMLTGYSTDVNPPIQPCTVQE